MRSATTGMERAQYRQKAMQEQEQRQKQIPFGDDNQNGKSNSNSNSNSNRAEQIPSVDDDTTKTKAMDSAASLFPSLR